MGTFDAQTFFESIPADEAGGFAFFDALLGDATANENGWRDYKDGRWYKNGPLHTADDIKESERKAKKYLGEYASAFSNTAGGILIFGIETTNETPTSLRLVSDCAALARRFEQLGPNATDPRAAEITVRAIPSGPGESEGLVIVLIWPSRVGPHRAMWDDRAYFMRLQSSNDIIPSALLRTMFYPRLVPQMRAKVEILVQRVPGAFAITTTLTLANLGPASAEDVIVSIDPTSLNQQWHLQNTPHWQQLTANHIQKLSYTMPPNLMIQSALTLSGTCTDSFVLKVLIFTHNTPMQYIEEIIDRGRLHDAAQDHQRIVIERNATFYSRAQA
ncbi:MAG: ATP-binding protein [Chthoniobacter sp.]|nr:ATP-binding protein [Chthoniobacter sp.]